MIHAGDFRDPRITLTPMETVQQQDKEEGSPVTVAQKVELYLESFRLCLAAAASVYPRELSLVDDQLARFST